MSSRKQPKLQGKNTKKAKSNLVRDIKQIAAARNRGEMTSDGGTSGRSDTNDCAL